MKKTTTKGKKVTLDSLAKMIAEGREKTNDLAKMIAEGREETSELARMVARGFESVDKRFAETKKEIAEVKKDISEVKENLATTRMDVLGIGDRFVSKHEFHQHLIRFSLLEQKVKSKK